MCRASIAVGDSVNPDERIGVTTLVVSAHRGARLPGARSPNPRVSIKLRIPRRSVALGQTRPVVVVRCIQLPVRQVGDAGGAGSRGMAVSEPLPVRDDVLPGRQAAVQRAEEHGRAHDAPDNDHPDKPIPSPLWVARVLPCHAQAGTSLVRTYRPAPAHAMHFFMASPRAPDSSPC